MLLANAPACSKYEPKLIEADSTSARLGQGLFDFVLTSPPYCTRLDYATATALELSILSSVIRVKTDDLSRSMMGSIKVPQHDINPDAAWGASCLDFLTKVKNHTSKASSTYYYKTHADYFNKLSKSMRNISGSLKQGSYSVYVVQDSYYKDVHNDLPLIFKEIAAANQLICIRQTDFFIRNTLAKSHPGAKKYAKPRDACESVLIMQKQSYK